MTEIGDISNPGRGARSIVVSVELHAQLAGQLVFVAAAPCILQLGHRLVRGLGQSRLVDRG